MSACEAVRSAPWANIGGLRNRLKSQRLAGKAGRRRAPPGALTRTAARTSQHKRTKPSRGDALGARTRCTLSCRAASRIRAARRRRGYELSFSYSQPRGATAHERQVRTLKLRRGLLKHCPLRRHHRRQCAAERSETKRTLPPASLEAGSQLLEPHPSVCRELLM